MKQLCLLSFLAGTSLIQTSLAQSPAADAEASSNNINSRYKVESVELPRSISQRISKSLRRDIEALTGQYFDAHIVASIASRIHKEIHRVVKHHLEKGFQPEQVRVVYDVRERQKYEDDAKVSKLFYNSKQGATAAASVGFNAGGNRFELGTVSDADTLLERYAGFNLAYSRRFNDHVRLRFEFETLHQQWNAATQTALLSRPDVPGIYRERLRMDPALVILLAPGLSLTAGLSFQHFQTQFPAARYEAANAVNTTLRHRKRWQSSDSSAGHEWNAGYNLRAATSLLNSDYIYIRHEADVRYSMRYASHHLTLRGRGGAVSSRAPLFERFTLGDSRALRGWNKFDVAPLGGTRSVYGSVQYTYRRVGGFYDTGAVWDRRTAGRVRHSAGLLLTLNRDREGPFLALGFPLRGGNVAPILILGMNF